MVCLHCAMHFRMDEFDRHERVHQRRGRRQHPPHSAFSNIATMLTGRKVIHLRLWAFQWAVAIMLVGCWGQMAVADERVPARVVSVNSDTHATIMQAVDSGKKWSLSGSDVQKIAGHYFEEGDLVTVTGEPPAAGADVSIRAAPISVWPRIITILISALVLLVLATIVSTWRPYLFLVGADNRVSNSKCQAVLWFGAGMTVYLATLILRLVESDWQLAGGIAMPANVLALTGLSGLTYAGAKMIAVTKNNGNPPVAAPADNTQPVAAGTQKQKATKPNWLSDLFTNDQGELDFGDFQMILIVWLSVVIYMVSAYIALGNLPLQEHASLPDVDGSLLAAFGVGQGTYLAKKAALPVGTG
jgi:hypothetical protein